MNRTARLITSGAAIVLTLVIMSVGIYAATKVSLHSGINLNFTKTNDVAVTVSGQTKLDDETANDLTIPQGGVFRPSLAGDAQGTYSDNISLGDITFTGFGSKFVITLRVTNDFESTPINAVYNASTTDTNGYVVISTTTAPDTDTTATTNYVNGTTASIAAGETLVITTTISITDVEDKQAQISENGFSNIPFDFSLDLTRGETPAA